MKTDKTPLVIVLPDIRSAMNIGAIFRTADAVGAKKIYISGYSATPNHPKVAKTAIGAEETVPWEYAENTVQLIEKLRKDGYQIVSLEKNEKSTPISSAKFTFPVALIAGNEISGVSKEVLSISDMIVHLPMLGTKESLNVATATGIAAYNILDRFRTSNK